MFLRRTYQFAVLASLKTRVLFLLRFEKCSLNGTLLKHWNYKCNFLQVGWSKRRLSDQVWMPNWVHWLLLNERRWQKSVWWPQAKNLGQLHFRRWLAIFSHAGWHLFGAKVFLWPLNRKMTSKECHYIGRLRKESQLWLMRFSKTSKYIECLPSLAWLAFKCLLFIHYL